MAGRSRLSIAKRQIEAYMDRLPGWVLSIRDLARVLEQNRDGWRLPRGLSSSDFIEYLCTTSHLRERRFEPTNESYKRVIARYSWREPSFLELGSSLFAHAYLSHGSAVFVHGLNDEMPKTVYVNREQSAKPPPSGELRQEGIDRAFARKSKQRKSQLVYVEDDRKHHYVVLAGKNSGRAGVVSQADPYGRPVEVTSLERTLIDIAVRPAYAGGVARVLEAYRGAAERASIGKVLSLLKSLDYVYPYHQCIGFYAERAGFRGEQLSRLRRLGLDYDFYLTYGMSDPVYVKEWRLHVPRDLQ